MKNQTLEFRFFNFLLIFFTSLLWSSILSAQEYNGKIKGSIDNVIIPLEGGNCWVQRGGEESGSYSSLSSSDEITVADFTQQLAYNLTSEHWEAFTDKTMMFIQQRSWIRTKTGGEREGDDGDDSHALSINNAYFICNSNGGSLRLQMQYGEIPLCAHVAMTRNEAGASYLISTSHNSPPLFPNLNLEHLYPDYNNGRSDNRDDNSLNPTTGPCYGHQRGELLVSLPPDPIGSMLNLCFNAIDESLRGDGKLIQSHDLLPVTSDKRLFKLHLNPEYHYREQEVKEGILKIGYCAGILKPSNILYSDIYTESGSSLMIFDQSR